MKTSNCARAVLSIALFLFAPRVLAQPAFPSGGGGPGVLDSWSFSTTNWLSNEGATPLGLTNIFDLAGGDGNSLWLDTTNSTPAYLFYRVVETNGVTNINCENGTISLWFMPNWSSTNLTGGTGPGYFGNLISLGKTNSSSWWSLYFSADGCNIYLSSQTNSGPSSNYLTAPVSLAWGNWYNIVLTYSTSNSFLYTNGILAANGSGVAYWPGTNATFFAIGSDSNGLYQARGMFDDLTTYDYQLDPGTIGGTFSMYSIVYYGRPVSYVTNAPSTNTIVPTFKAISGAGFLTTVSSNSSGCVTSSNIWMTNFSATALTNNTVSVTFTIMGGTNGLLYDVFATSYLMSPITNAWWSWLGQGYHCSTYTITNLPADEDLCFILGTPQDSDGDGLTDAYELLVSHTNPYNPNSGGSGMLDGWAVMFGLDPRFDSSANSALRSNFTYDPVGRLELITGIRSEGLTNDFEGNVLVAH
jgi:hypothetical protein